MRRTLAGLALVGVAVAVVIAGRSCGSRTPRFALDQSSNQNILLITIDTLRADAVGAYGGQAATPTLDVLSAAGARFTFAHAHAVMTLPSHASILTGTYPFQHGIRDNSGYRLEAQTPTLARLAKDAGYATAAFIGAFPLDSRFGLDAGFDVYDDRVEADGDGLEFVLPERRADAVTRSAQDWIAAQQGRWLAWVHLFDPHAPYAPPPPFDATYRQRPYDGEVAYVDRVLGGFLESVRRSQSRPTLVVITADHGEGLGDHGEPTHGLLAYESTLRVPLIVAQLGAPARTGSVVDTPARHVDILPTIATAVHLPLPGNLPGRPLPLFRSESTLNPFRVRSESTLNWFRVGSESPLNWFRVGSESTLNWFRVRSESTLNWFGVDSERTVSYFEAMSASLTRGWAPLTGVIAERDKYVDLPIPELYDLQADPAESANVLDARAERTRVLRGILAGLGDIAPAAPSPDPAAAHRLAALGYLSGSAPRKARYTDEDDPKRLLALERLLHEGVDLARRGHTAAAIDRYRQIIAKRRDMSVAYRHLAAILIDAGEAVRAVTILNDAIAAGVRDPQLELELFETTGMLRLMEGHERAARDAFERALSITETSAPAHNGLGVLALRAGRRDEAIRHWRAAVESDAADFDALFNLATELVNAGRLGEARPHLERFVSDAPRSRYAADIDRLQRTLSRP
jgi:tetratricopeptide (TPR) repeat protein